MTKSIRHKLVNMDIEASDGEKWRDAIYVAAHSALSSDLQRECLRFIGEGEAALEIPSASLSQIQDTVEAILSTL
jgi:hypothetical protein